VPAVEAADDRFVEHARRTDTHQIRQVSDVGS
jgi:hypothetical protein